MRQVTESQAREVLEECALDAFVLLCSDLGGLAECLEYRFVDCHPEHETPARLAMIEAANKRLAELFGVE